MGLKLLRCKHYSKNHKFNEPWWHIIPFLPLSHPLRQLPFTWWHCSPCIHFPQISVHPKPYVLFLHSVIHIVLLIVFLRLYNLYFFYQLASVKIKKVYLSTFSAYLSCISNWTTETRSSDDVTVNLLTILRTQQGTIFSVFLRRTSWKATNIV